MTSFLVDECVQGAIARSIAFSGYDILHVADVRKGAADDHVAAIAVATGRVVVTEDYDFDKLAIRRGLTVPGILLGGCGAMRPEERPIRVRDALRGLVGRLEGHLTIIEPKRVRQRAFPRS